MIQSHRENTPKIHPTARLAEQSTVVGNVTLGAMASLWHGAVVRGDTAPISIGAGSNLQDNVVVHADAGSPVSVGTDVTVGHGAILHGCTVEDGALIGMGAILLNGSTVGAGAMVAAGALLPQGAAVPPGHLAVGSPAKIVRPLREAERAGLVESAAEYRLLAAEQLPAAEEGDAP